MIVSRRICGVGEGAVEFEGEIEARGGKGGGRKRRSVGRVKGFGGRVRDV